MSGSEWYISGSKEFSITNNSGVPINLANGNIRLSLPDNFSGEVNIWSAYINKGWVQINKVKANQFSIDQILEPGQTLSFELKLALGGGNLTPANWSVSCILNGKAVPSDGAVSISAVSQLKAPVPGKIHVTLTGAQLVEPITVAWSNLSSPLEIKNIPHGSYTLTASIDDPLYTTTVSPSSVDVSSATSTPMTIFYKKAADPTRKNLIIKMPAKPISPQAKVAIPTGVVFTVKNAAGESVSSQLINWGKSFTIQALPVNQVYTVSATSFFDGKMVEVFSQTLKLTANTTVNVAFQGDSNTVVKQVNFLVSNLGTASATASINTSSFGGLNIGLKSLKNGSNLVTLPVAIYAGSGLASTAASAKISSFDVSTLSSVPVNFVLGDYGQIIYHTSFPYTSSQTTAESLPLTSNYTDLFMSNFIAGVLLGTMVHENPTYANIHFNKDYLYGSLLAQLLQENINTSAYVKTSNFINPDAGTRNLLLSVGQGGPYQLNDYSKRLENSSGSGMINYVAAQKSLGYSIAAQDSGLQNSRINPDSLDDKYFGPLAAAYFHYNDLVRMERNNAISSGPQATTWGPMMSNFSSKMTDSNSFFEMVLNACYNAGPWSTIMTRYAQLAANYDNPTYATAIKNIANYSLSDAEYNSIVGVNSYGTFIIYPRQIRFYLDQLYNASPVMTTDNSMLFPMSQLKEVFAKTIGTLGYVNASGEYVYIPQSVCDTAFDQALSLNGVTLTQTLSISNGANRAKIFAVLESALNNVSTTLNIKFNQTTEKTLNGAQ